MENTLTDKEKAFVQEYLVDLNATQAAIRAGYSVKGAAVAGHRHMRKPEVLAAIDKAQGERQKRTLVTQDRVVNELAKIAFGDVRDVMSWGAEGVLLKDSCELNDHEAASVAEVCQSRTREGASIKLKRHDKIKALELLGKHLGIFKDRFEMEGAMNINALTQEQIDAIYRTQTAKRP